jgi:hypothetical protein
MQRRVGAQEPRVATYPPYETTAGPAVCDLMDAIGLPMDRWQSFVLQHGLGIGVDGLWTAPTVGTWVSRQNGKGNIILAREIGGLYIFGERLISHSAHLFQTAEEGFMRLKDAIEGSSMLSRRIKSVKEGNSGKGVVTMDGARLRVMARGPNTGRGMTIDCLIPDEAQELDAVQVKSLGPTQSAVPNPQAWYFGTPPSSPEAWAYQLRKAGHAGSPGMAFFDWGASLDLNDPHLAIKVANRDLWYAANPGLGIRITERFLEAELALLGPVDFAIEHLGVWLPKDEGVKKEDIGLEYETWESCLDELSKIAEYGELSFAVDVGPAREYASIVVYGERDDAAGHVELIKYELGTGWVVDKLVDLRERFDPIAIGIDGKGPVSSLIPKLAKVGIKPPASPDRPRRGDLFILGVNDATSAAGGFVDSCRIGEIFHIGQEQLNLAVKNAKPRPLGDAWAWGRRHSTGDISPLVAASAAHYVHGIRHGQVMSAYDPSENIG